MEDFILVSVVEKITISSCQFCYEKKKRQEKGSHKLGVELDTKALP